MLERQRRIEEYLEGERAAREDRRKALRNWGLGITASVILAVFSTVVLPRLATSAPVRMTPQQGK
jgi:hypothetical protein